MHVQIFEESVDYYLQTLQNSLKGTDTSLLLTSLHQMELALNGKYQPIIYHNITVLSRNLSTSKIQNAPSGNVNNKCGLETNSQKKSPEFSGM